MLRIVLLALFLASIEAVAVAAPLPGPTQPVAQSLIPGVQLAYSPRLCRCGTSYGWCQWNGRRVRGCCHH
jgi:hypothetical protein